MISLRLEELRSVTVDIQFSDDWIKGEIETSHLLQLITFRLTGRDRIVQFLNGRCSRLSNLTIDGPIVIGKAAKGGFDDFFGCCNNTLEKLYLSRIRAGNSYDICSLSFAKLQICEFIAADESMLDIDAPNLNMVFLAAYRRSDFFFQHRNPKLFQSAYTMNVYLTESTTKSVCQSAYKQLEEWWKSNVSGFYFAFLSWIETAEQHMLLGTHGYGPILQELKCYPDQKTFFDKIDSARSFLEEKRSSPISIKFNYWIVQPELEHPHLRDREEYFI